MDGEDNHDVCLETRLHVSESAWENSEATDFDKRDEIYSTFDADCEVSTGIPTRCMDDNNILHGLKHERPEDMRADPDYSRKGDGRHGNKKIMVNCLPSVKCEEQRQELNEQNPVLPFNSTDQETSLAYDANEPIQVKQEATEDLNEYDKRNEATRRWIVCPDGVLKEIEAEHTSDVSDVLSVEDCSVNVGHKPITHTCTHHNNINDDETIVTLCMDSTCGLSSTHVRRHDRVLKVIKTSCEGVKPFTCDTCGKSFAQSKFLKAHKRTHTGIKPFICDTCGKSFAQPGKLTNHKTIHTGVKPFTCDTCGKPFAVLGQLKKHKITHTSVKPFTCDTCGKSFAQPGQLTTHKRTHTGVKPFTCDTCGKPFADSGHLKRHKRTHTGVKPFTCDTCGKSFAHSGYLNMHKRMHTSHKPFTCDPCGISFAQAAQLNYHQMAHTGVRPFTCDTCGKSYVASGHLKRHEMTHTGIKHFTCDICGKSYTVSRHLKWHQMTHSSVIPFTCDTDVKPTCDTC